MPRLGRTNIVRLNMPSSTPDDPAWMDVNLTFDAGLVIDATDAGESNSAVIAAVLPRIITQWNYTGEDGEIAPINSDTVRKLPIGDFNAVAERVGDAIQSVAGTEQVADGEKKS